MLPPVIAVYPTMFDVWNFLVRNTAFRTYWAENDRFRREQCYQWNYICPNPWQGFWIQKASLCVQLFVHWIVVCALISCNHFFALYKQQLITAVTPQLHSDRRKLWLALCGNNGSICEGTISIRSAINLANCSKFTLTLKAITVAICCFEIFASQSRVETSSSRIDALRALSEPSNRCPLF